MDIIVTTPRSEMAIAALEAEACKSAGEDSQMGYFRKLGSRRPKNLEVGDRIFYVEDGYIRGFATIDSIADENCKCSVTGRNWKGWTVFMKASSWKWIRPVPTRGFQGWRYFNNEEIEVVGGWLDPKPAEPSVKTVVERV